MAPDSLDVFVIKQPWGHHLPTLKITFLPYLTSGYNLTWGSVQVLLYTVRVHHF